MYDPTIARWLSQDPIGLAAGDVDLWRYVRNDAPNAIDPTGEVGFFFDGTWMTEKDNDIIRQIQEVYQDPKEEVYRFPDLFGGLLDARSLADDKSTLFQYVDQAAKAACAANSEGHAIDIFGYSRGAVAALVLASKLNETHIPVRFLGLLDPSATLSGIDTGGHSPSSFFPISPNVKVAWIGLSRRYERLSDPPKSSILKDIIRAGRNAASTFIPDVTDRNATRVTTDTFKDTHLELGKDPSVGFLLAGAAIKAGVPLAKNPFALAPIPPQHQEGDILPQIPPDVG